MSAYVRPGSIDEALALLDAPDARPLSGGTDLIPLQSRGKAAGTLVDVRALLGDAIEAQGDGLVIGAATRVADVAGDPRVFERYAVLAQAAGQAASPQLRNQGTVAGNLAQHVGEGFPGTLRRIGFGRSLKRQWSLNPRRHASQVQRSPGELRQCRNHGVVQGGRVSGIVGCENLSRSCHVNGGLDLAGL